MKTSEDKLQTVSTETWTREEVFNSGDEALDCLLKQIRLAKRTIDFEIYIYHQDICGDEFAKELTQAAQRGVAVRLMVDGIGAFGFSNLYYKKLLEAGVLVRIYHPTPFDIHKRPYFWWMPWKGYWKYLGRVNKRNHRKVLIVDDESVVVGSVNVSRSHLSVARGGLGWRDSAVLLQGVAVKSFAIAFDRAWEYASKLTFSPAPIIPLAPALFNFSARLRRMRYLLLLELIYRAEQRVWITNAYFVPDGSLLKALRFAAWTGADVCIIVPQVSDLHFMRLVSNAFYLGLLTAGVRIFEYLPSVLHSKTLIIDNVGVIGTTNLNHRSLLHDLEVDVMLKKESSVTSLAGAFHEDLKNCKEVTIKDWEARPWLERVLGNLLLFLRYWL